MSHVLRMDARAHSAGPGLAGRATTIPIKLLLSFFWLIFFVIIHAQRTHADTLTHRIGCCCFLFVARPSSVLIFHHIIHQRSGNSVWDGVRVPTKRHREIRMIYGFSDKLLGNNSAHDIFFFICFSSSSSSSYVSLRIALFVVAIHRKDFVVAFPFHLERPWILSGGVRDLRGARGRIADRSMCVCVSRNR